LPAFSIDTCGEGIISNDSFGGINDKPPVTPVYRDNKIIGYSKCVENSLFREELIYTNDNNTQAGLD